MALRRFIQCDVFSSVPTRGNGLAVVVDGEGLPDEEMQIFAAWTNLAETTFLMAPTTAAADYKVRIFTPAREMLFAGHPTLGSCASWLHAGGSPAVPGIVRQECGVGIVNIDINGEVPAFAAPATTVEQLQPDALHAITSALGLSADRILRTALLTNGPTWQVLELASADDVLAADSSKVVYPEFVGVGLIGAHAPGGECQFEVRSVSPSGGMSEDPITGSLNAAIAQWMYSEGHWRDAVTIAQGTCIGRHGRLFIRRENGSVWIGGHTQILIDGMLSL
jgi:PhzF family phenazine biosynthesis protein